MKMFLTGLAVAGVILWTIIGSAITQTETVSMAVNMDTKKCYYVDVSNSAGSRTEECGYEKGKQYDSHLVPPGSRKLRERMLEMQRSVATK